MARQLTACVRWLVAASLVFQVSATLGARLNPVETFTAVHRPRPPSGR
ncbi:MAG TPA: hypothetical protein VG318_09795 [Actinomycetota bacterium]|nr:hypothetical protein [Actinomycetota bacterium]